MVSHEFKQVIEVPEVWHSEDAKLARIYRAMQAAAYAEIEEFYRDARNDAFHSARKEAEDGGS